MAYKNWIRVLPVSVRIHGQTRAYQFSSVGIKTGEVTVLDVTAWDFFLHCFTSKVDSEDTACLSFVSEANCLCTELIQGANFSSTALTPTVDPKDVSGESCPYQYVRVRVRSVIDSDSFYPSHDQCWLSHNPSRETGLQTASQEQVERFDVSFQYAAHSQSKSEFSFNLLHGDVLILRRCISKTSFLCFERATG